ncbi:MAG: hypothetical protein KDA80_20205 [Planctomycetaceae bacterium]|nr:hypothetical protein [Planctomycetaceae bacterium]
MVAAQDKLCSDFPWRTVFQEIRCGVEKEACGVKSVRNTVGFLLQFIALVIPPLLIVWQLDFGFPLLMMPTMTLVAVILFVIGHSLRDKAD